MTSSMRRTRRSRRSRSSQGSRFRCACGRILPKPGDLREPGISRTRLRAFPQPPLAAPAATPGAVRQPGLARFDRRHGRLVVRARRRVLVERVAHGQLLAGAFPVAQPLPVAIREGGQCRGHSPGHRGGSQRSKGFCLHGAAKFAPHRASRTMIDAYRGCYGLLCMSGTHDGDSPKSLTA